MRSRPSTAGSTTAPFHRSVRAKDFETELHRRAGICLFRNWVGVQCARFNQQSSGIERFEDGGKLMCYQVMK